jgi:hemerythrin superfamily protein
VLLPETKSFVSHALGNGGVEPTARSGERRDVVADLLEQLEAEHREAKSLLDRLEKAEEPDERQPLLTELDAALIQHMQTEERVVYPVLAELDDEDAEEARAEHDGARELLAKLRSGGVDQPGFGSIVSALKGAIEHHVEEEENEIFPKLRREVGTERFAGGADGAGARGAGGGVDGGDARASARRDPSSMTRDELYEEAKQLGIDGRSSMSKAQLAKAVAKADSKS